MSFSQILTKKPSNQKSINWFKSLGQDRTRRKLVQGFLRCSNHKSVEPVKERRSWRYRSSPTRVKLHQSKKGWWCWWRRLKQLMKITWAFKVLLSKAWMVMKACLRVSETLEWAAAIAEARKLVLQRKLKKMRWLTSTTCHLDPFPIHKNPKTKMIINQIDQVNC